MQAALGGSLPVFDVRVYGAVGDGITDDTEAIRSCVTAASVAGGNVVFQPVTYKVADPLAAGTITVGSHVTMLLFGATFDISSAPNNFALFTAAGSLGTHYPLTADTTVGGSTLTVAAGDDAHFALDDYVLVGSEGYYEQRTLLYGAGTGQKLGEIGRVLSTVSTTVTLNHRLAAGYVDTSAVSHLVYKTADTAFLAKITPVEDVHFLGGMITGKTGSGTASTQMGILIRFGVGCTIRDTRAKHVAYNGFTFRSCVDCHMDVGGADFWNTNNGYACSLADASQDCTVNVVASKCRHAFTTESIGGSYGVVRRCKVSGSSWYTTSTGDGFDSHAAAEDITYDNVRSFSSAGQGINFEGSRCTILGADVRFSASHGISVHNETLMPAQVSVKAARVMRPGIGGATSHGIVFSAPVTAGANTELWGLDLDGEVYYPSGIGIYATGSASIQYDGCRISGTVWFSQSTTAAFFTQYIDKAKMIGCEAKNIIASSVGMRQDNCSHGTITGCTAFGLNATSNSGVYVKNADSITIVANSFAGLAKGVNLDNTSTNCVVGFNDLAGCTSPLSQGSGAGHKIAYNGGVTDTALAANYQLLSTNASTFTVPTGITKLRIRAIGGGGGGGGGGATAGTTLQAGGGGGAAGTIVEAEVTVAPGDVLTMTIPAASGGGNGGTGGGNNPGSNGTSGGNVVVVNTTAGTTLLTAQGGTKGNGAAANTATQPGGGLYGNGSASVTASQMWPGCGAPGGANSLYPIGPVVGGAGGGPASTTLGGGAGGAQLSAANLTIQTAGGSGTSGTTSGVTGTTATMPGCGGGGGGGGGNATGTGGTGGSGALGQVEIWW